MKAQLPVNEDARLEHLYNLNILDTPREQSFDDIAHLVMMMCEVPIAVVSLVDKDRQWFKSCLGLDATETSRDVAFCAHAILSPNDLLVVEDALQDPRFFDNDLVLGEPHIRFYAGAPLVMKTGAVLGTLCVIDNRVRSLTPSQKDALLLLAQQVVRLLELREAHQYLIEQQRALEHERNNLAAVIKGTNIGTWQWNVQTGETIFNERWAAIVGYTLAELSPITITTWLRLAHPDDLQHSGELLVKHFNGELDYYDCKCRMKHKDGHWVWVHDRGQVFTRTEKGDPEWMFGTHADITQAEETNKAIALNEQKLSTLYNLSPVAIALNRLSDGQFLDANPEFFRMLGYTKNEFNKLTYWDITPSEYADQEINQLRELKEKGRYGPYEKKYIHKDGHQFSVLLNGVCVLSEEGDEQIWSIIQDITERKRIEQMKNEFVSAVSHELRTPLTSISGALTLMVNGMLGDPPEKMKSMLGIAHKNTQRLMVLINDLLDIEKLLAGKMNFDMKVQSVLPIIETSVDSIKTYNTNTSITFRVDAEDSDDVIEVDALRLQQVITNFLSNAIKFSPSNSEVVIKVARLDHQLRIAVIDHGPGVSDEFRERIFQKFSQADASDSRQRGGTGLGLAITKELIERMNGTVGFESVLGEGSTFYAQFPLTQHE